MKLAIKDHFRTDEGKPLITMLFSGRCTDMTMSQCFEDDELEEFIASIKETLVELERIQDED